MSASKYSAVVLRNKGFDVPVYVLDEDGNRVVDGSDEPKTETAYVRFTGSTLYDIEEAFGSIDGWNTAMEANQWIALCRTLGLVWNTEPRRVAAMVDETQRLLYEQIVLAAWSIANGVDPASAGKGVTKVVEAFEKAKLALNEDLERRIEKVEEEKPNDGSPTDTPGTVSSETGSASAKKPRRSGT